MAKIFRLGLKLHFSSTQTRGDDLNLKIYLKTVTFLPLCMMFSVAYATNNKSSRENHALLVEIIVSLAKFYMFYGFIIFTIPKFWLQCQQ